ncbi:hypothetical protein BpHYR1_022530, partial [Brachionus plicatilis]
MVGTGVIVLAVLWSISFVFFILFCGAQGKIKLLPAIPTLISLIVTIVLLSLPRGDSAIQQTEPDYKFSYTGLIWILILTSICVGLLVSFIMFFVYVIVEPRYAKVDKIFLNKPDSLDNAI